MNTLSTLHRPRATALLVALAMSFGPGGVLPLGAVRDPRQLEHPQPQAAGGAQLRDARELLVGDGDAVERTLGDGPHDRIVGGAFGEADDAGPDDCNAHAYASGFASRSCPL